MLTTKDIIELGCLYADGFSTIEDEYCDIPVVIDPYDDMNEVDDFPDNPVLWPLFLTRVIEGINRKSDDHLITINITSCQIIVTECFPVPYADPLEKYFNYVDDIDGAKYKAIEHTLYMSWKRMCKANGWEDFSDQMD